MKMQDDITTNSAARTCSMVVVIDFFVHVKIANKTGGKVMEQNSWKNIAGKNIFHKLGIKHM